MSNNIREDCGSSNLNYSSKTWDNVCYNYFKNSGWDIENFYGDVLYVGMGSNYGPRNQSNEKFDIIVLDIWAKYIDSNEFKIIYPKFKKYLKKDGKIHVIKTLKVRK